MKTTTAIVEIEGVSPILMHNAQLANPANEWAQKMGKIHKKHHTKKTEADSLELIYLEFNGGLYFDDEIGPYIPDFMLEGMIRDAAKSSRRGKDVESGLMVDPARVPLEYKGPRDREKLYSDKRFVDVRGVKLQKSSTVMRTRPRFDEWAATFEVTTIDDVLNMSDVQEFIVLGGRVKGIFDYRPKFGRFIVKAFEIV